MLTIKRKVYLILRIVKENVLYIFYILLTLIYKVKLEADEVMNYAETVVDDIVENAQNVYQNAVQSVRQLWSLYYGANSLALIRVRSGNAFQNKVNYTRTNVRLSHDEKYKLYSNLLAPPQF